MCVRERESEREKERIPGYGAPEHVEHDVGDVGVEEDEHVGPDPVDEVGVGCGPTCRIYICRRAEYIYIMIEKRSNKGGTLDGFGCS